MFFAPGGLIMVVVVYLLVAAVIGAALYFVVRLAVLHALKAHTIWLEQRASTAG